MLRELAGEIAAPPDTVLAALARRLDPEGASGFFVDPEARFVVVQGDYWFRGEYVVAPSPTGSTVRYTIVNVARAPRFLGAVTGRGVVRAAPAEFAELLVEIGGQIST